MKHGGVSSIKFRDIAQDYFVQNNRILFSYERVQILFSFITDAVIDSQL